MPLRGLLIAEPVASLAGQIADGCERLAEQRQIAGTGELALAAARELHPEMIILSLELGHPGAEQLIATLRQELPDACIVVTFRELALSTMERLRKLGAEDFISQPVDLKAFYRAASIHFDRAFRRYERHPVSLDVRRADGVVIGRTIDVSEGGMLLQAVHPMMVGDSFLVDLEIGLDSTVRVRCYVLEVKGEPPMAVTARAEFQHLRGRDHETLMAFLNQLARERSGKERG